MNEKSLIRYYLYKYPINLAEIEKEDLTLGSPVAHHNAEERMRKLSEQLNEIQMLRALEAGRIPTEFKPVLPHALRHTFATRLMEKKMPIEIISQLLGHSDIRITQQYMHILDDTLNKEVQKIGNIFELK